MNGSLNRVLSIATSVRLHVVEAEKYLAIGRRRRHTLPNSGVCVRTSNTGLSL